MSGISKKHKKTVIERTQVSPNWEAFLKAQPPVKAVAKKPFTKNNKELNSYYKALRLEKKAAIKQNNAESKGRKIVDSSKDSEIVKPAKMKSNHSDQPILTNFIGMDCEMVGIGDDARENMLARVSLVNKFGDCIYDKFVQPRERVMDYRTPVSGVRKEDMDNGELFEVVQKAVANILKGRILVGHSLKNDIEVLFLSHPAHKIRDTSRYKPFREVSKGSTPSLKKLAKELLGVDIQSGEHSSVEDARAAMQLYCLHSKQWEDTLSRKRNMRRHANNQNI